MCFSYLAFTCVLRERDCVPVCRPDNAARPVCTGGTLHFSAVKGNLKYLVPSLTVKMIVLPAIITVAATAMGFGSLERFVLFTMYATPVATASYSMAQNMGGDGELAGQFVVVSTAASIATIFLWVLLFKSMGMI